ncbi:MAG: carboxypeptidase regulatory-like domain-containing protein [Candidatus Goldbacteria bacterium]|nr:carboxypeptidase regulatory-like domain-containing protein [Candidatus Goldiibacteriota bacterium]
MKLFRDSKGLTFIEVIIASFVIVFLVMGSLNLITRVYNDIFASRVKTYAFNIAAENIENIKSYNFGSLKLTPDNLLPYPLTKLESDSNPWGNPADPSNILPVGGIQMKVYKIVQNAEEDDEGNIVGRTQADLPLSNLKKIRVIIAYQVKSASGGFMDRTTELETFVSNPESQMSGATIRGRVLRKERNCGNCNPAPPGHATKSYVHVEGFPQYSVKVGTEATTPQERGYYTIYNVLPGTYKLYTQGEGYERAEYENNPVIIEVTTNNVNGVNFFAPDIQDASISGTILDSSGNPINVNDYKKESREIRADDGTSFTTTADTHGDYSITGINPDVGSVSITAIFTHKDTGVTYYGAYPARVAVNNNSNITNVNITLQPVAGNTAVLMVQALDARDKSTPIGNINIVLKNVVTDAVMYTATTAPVSGIATILVDVGNYKITGAGNYYVPEEPTRFISVAAAPPVVKLYFYPSGSISGQLIDFDTNLPPAGPINLQAYSEYSRLVGSASSDTITGQYQFDGVWAGTNNVVRIFPEASSYAAYPDESAESIYSILVTQGNVTPNQNFTVQVNAKEVSGKLQISAPGVGNDIMDGAMIIAQPSSITTPPHIYSLDSVNADEKIQTSLKRKKIQFYGMVSERTGAYKIMLPANTDYDLYAYYSYVSYPASTILKYYKKITGVTPPSSDQDFSGAWITY